MKRAVELVKDEPSFHNLLGNIMSKIRHFQTYNQAPSEDEIFHLRKAIILREDCAWYACDLARTYVDLSRSKPNWEKRRLISIASDLYR